MIGRVSCPRLAILALVSIAILTTPLVPVPRADAQPKTLVVTGYGGRWSEVMKKALVEPFEKAHGVKVEVVTGITTEWVAKLMAAGPDNPPYDVVFGNEPAFPIPRERGFFDKRNETLAPNIKNLYPKALIGDTSLAMFWGRIGLAYRTDSGIKKPTSWKDFWDEAYAGKRATYVIGNTLGINFLFMVSKIFGKDYFDVDAGIAAIKRAQPKLVDFSGTIEKQLEQKEVVHRGAPRRGLATISRSGASRSTGPPRARASRSSIRSSRSRAAPSRRISPGSSSTPISRPRSSSPSPPSSSGARPTRRSRCRRTWRRRSSTGPPTSTSSCSSTGRTWPSSVRSGPRSGTRRCVDRRSPRHRHRHADRPGQALRRRRWRSTGSRWRWPRASSSRSSGHPGAARPPRCARWPASSRRTPAMWRSTAASSPGSPRTGGASGWCSSTTRSSRTAPSSRTSASAFACSAWTRRRSPGGWPRPWRSSSFRATARAIPASSRAASSSGWRWRERSSPAPPSCSSTSRSARSTRSCATT